MAKNDDNPTDEQIKKFEASMKRTLDGTELLAKTVKKDIKALEKLLGQGEDEEKIQDGFDEMIVKFEGFKINASKMYQLSKKATKGKSKLEKLKQAYNNSSKGKKFAIAVKDGMKAYIAFKKLVRKSGLKVEGVKMPSLKEIKGG